MKKLLAMILSAVILLTSLTACATRGSQADAGPTVSPTPAQPRAEAGEMTGKLKILTERFYWNYDEELTRFNKSCPVYSIINQAAKYMMLENPGLEIEVEALSINEDERDNEVQQRRVALMAGDVPDVYLLPTHSSLDIIVRQKEFLFRDVEQAMTNGWFYDVSGFYNGDTELHTEELHPTIMDAGTIGSARYVLPLWYSFPVIYARKDMIEDSGIDWEAMGAGTEELNQAVLDVYEKTGDPAWATYYDSGHSLDLLPPLCDYESENVLVKPQDFVDYFDGMDLQEEVHHANWEKLKQIEEETGVFPSHSISLDSFLMGEGYCLDESVATVVVPLESAFDIVPSGKSLGYEIAMKPVRSVDHKLNAQVSYWGAVSSACKEPAKAYEFLRFFLTPEVQHGGQLENFDFAVHDGSGIELSVGPMPGWPVRYKGFAEKQWGRHLEEIGHTSYGGSAKEAVLQVEIDDSDFAILDEPIDGVRFPSVLDMEFLKARQSGEEGEDPQTSRQKRGNAFVRDVKYHLAEG